MKGDIWFLIQLAISFLPFIIFAFLNGKANVKKEKRYKQYPMPIFAVVYSAVLLIFLTKISDLILNLFLKLVDLFESLELPAVADFIYNIYSSWGIYLTLVLFNTAAMLAYIIIKRIVTAILGAAKIKEESFRGKLIKIFYTYNEKDNAWYIKEHYGQGRTFIKTAYYGCCIVSGLALLISCALCMAQLISAPFYPVFAIIIVGEVAFFIDGLRADELKANLKMQKDKGRRIAMYPLLRKPLKALFGDKLSAEGTTVNNGSLNGGAIEDILADLDKNGSHIGQNYANFIRRKMDRGFKPNIEYVRSGYDLAIGKSLLFNTPFYDKLNPYVFYAMNRSLLMGGKALIVLGQHGTEQDLLEWSEKGMQQVSNIPNLWNIELLTDTKTDEENLPDIGIISRSGVHDLDIHKNNLAFLHKVSFVVIVEPSKLVTTAQIGLNLLIKYCGNDNAITFCSMDRNCDGLVDALSHILMTNITEVNATEYPRGMSSYMYWTEDNDYLQHRILPGISRFLGMGTELSMVALKNQVKQAVWYGGDAFPVLDAHWIAKQYYHDLLEYAQLPANQETFDRVFKASFNMCDQRVSDYSFVTVEDDRNNLFEIRRNFATIAEEQSFVNVISSEYMLREYMATNPELFTADAKAIPYITADYARTKRNSILSLCLLLCADSVPEETLNRQMVMLGIDTTDPAAELWKEICQILGDESHNDKKGNPILSVKKRNGDNIEFEKDNTIIFKREYSVETGKFESIYTIENQNFSRIILDDLQMACYIAEQESKDVYIGTELKGHVYQKYLPGQFFTLNGKYYEMISTATDNRILVRRASEHIGGRLSYRQLRNYKIHRTEDSSAMGALKTINNIDIHYQFADFSVETSGYWKLRAYNDFTGGALVQLNGVPTREYRHKQILKFDFSKLGDAFNDSVRMTLTNLLNEVFSTLFADNQPFISAITPGSFDAPITYGLELDETIENADKCIYVIEDSQLDIGLLVAVERNINRIFQIISDYLAWNAEKIEESLRAPEEEAVEQKEPTEQPEEEKKPKTIFGRIANWFKNLFKKKKKDVDVPAQDYMMIYGKPHKLVNGKWVACSQEEFDEKMKKRHEAIDEKAQIEKEERQKAKESAKEAEQSAENADADGAGDNEKDAQSDTPDQPSDESEEVSEDQDSLETVEEQLTPRQRRKAEKEAKKAAKRAAAEQRKAEKAAAKAAKAAEKEARKNAEAEPLETNNDEPIEPETPDETSEGSEITAEESKESELVTAGAANDIEQISEEQNEAEVSSNE